MSLLSLRTQKWKWSLPSGRVMLTADRLRELFKYNKRTGVFTRAVAVSGHTVKTIAGTLNARGYVLIRVDYIQYRAHKLAWLYVTGSWPSAEIDHRNGVRNDNRWTNLRDATRTQNARNQRVAHITNKSAGVLGVSFERGKWSARIRTDNGRKRLGRFDTITEADAAYREAKIKHHIGV